MQIQKIKLSGSFYDVDQWCSFFDAENSVLSLCFLYSPFQHYKLSDDGFVLCPDCEPTIKSTKRVLTPNFSKEDNMTLIQSLVAVKDLNLAEKHLRRAIILNKNQDKILSKTLIVQLNFIFKLKKMIKESKSISSLATDIEFGNFVSNSSCSLL